MGAGLVSYRLSLPSPAINVLAIILTTSVLGPSLSIARAVGAVLFAALIGLAAAPDLPQKKKPSAALSGELEAEVMTAVASALYFASRSWGFLSLPTRRRPQQAGRA